MSVVSHMTQTVVVGKPDRVQNDRGEWQYGDVTVRSIVSGCSVQPGLMDGLEGTYQGDGKVAYTMWMPPFSEIERWDYVVLVDSRVADLYPSGYDGIWVDDRVPHWRVDAHPQRWEMGTHLDHVCAFLVGAD